MRHTKQRQLESCKTVEQNTPKDSVLPMVKCVVDVARLTTLGQHVD